MKNRKITYSKALNEALHSQMSRDRKMVVYGIEDKMFGSNEGLLKKFGAKRFFYTPLSEDMLTGFSLGLAISGVRSVFNHIRVDFLLLGMNQIANMISSYSYASNGKKPLPLVIRAVIGRGWGQGYQHSKSLQSIFAHIPGLKVIMPTTPYDAKGMLLSALEDNNPVICLEHRWLYWQKGHVPKKYYKIPLGKANILRKGKDVTIISTSWMNVEACQAADFLKNHGISCEVVDVRSISPLDKKTLIKSVKKTKRCIVADYDWLFCGFSAEVSDLIYANVGKALKAPIQRIGFAPTPCPTSRYLENQFYPNAKDIINIISKTFKRKINTSKVDLYSHEKVFKGPF
jgi:pyruvate dehydrogenase E1 component beta subunit